MLDVAIQFAWGLHYAHEQGLVHQDVKPANVMMTREGIAKVTDFGLAKARAVTGGGGAARGGQGILVSSGGMTPAYCSPEQAAGQSLSRKTDIWSWAVSILEMLVGEVTWMAGQAAAEALAGYLETGPADASLPAMPAGVVELLKRCFQRNPLDRPGNMSEVAAALQQIYEQEIGELYPRQAPEAIELKADGLNNHGVSYLDLGREEDTIRCWQEALKADPYHLETNFNLGYWRWRNGEILDDVYVSQMEVLESSRGSDPDYWRYLGWIHLERGDIEEIEKIQQSAHRIEEEEFTKALEDKGRPVGRLIRTLEDQTDWDKWDGSVCYSPDGRFALTGSGFNWGAHVRLWDLASGRQVKGFGDRARAVKHVCFSPDGRYALFCSGFIRLWDASSGREGRVFEGSSTHTASVCFSPDGHYALSGDLHKRVTLWEVASGSEVRQFEGHTDEVNSVCFSPDGRYALSGSGNRFASKDSTIRLWEVASGREIRQLQGHAARVMSVGFSPDGRYALSGSYDKTVRLWEVTSGREVRQFEGHTSGVTSVCFSPDGRYALSGSNDKTVRLWDVASGRALRQFRRHTSGVESICFSPDGRYALSSEGGSVPAVRMWEVYYPVTDWGVLHPYPRLCSIKPVTRLGMEWDQVRGLLKSARDSMKTGSFRQAFRLLQEAQSVPGYERDSEVMGLLTKVEEKGRRTGLRGARLLRTLKGHTQEVNSVCFSPDGRYALSGSAKPLVSAGYESDDNTIRLWEVASGKGLNRFEGHSELVRSVCFSPDGRFALSGGPDETVRLWVVASGREVRQFRGQERTSSVGSVCFSPDGRCVLLGGWSASLRLWKIASGRGHTWRHLHGPMHSLACSPDGCHALSGHVSRAVLWDLASGREVRMFDVGPWCKIRSVCFSPDGRYALGGPDKTVRLWEVSSGREVRRFEGHTDDVQSVSFSPDGLYALSGGADKTVRLWEVASGREVWSSEGHTDLVSSVSFSPDGCYALSGGWDATIRQWEFSWEWEYPEPADWDEGAWPYVETFLTLHTRRFLGLFRRTTWAEDDFKKLLTELSRRGYGWLRPEGVRRELEKMAREWKGPPPLRGAAHSKG